MSPSGPPDHLNQPGATLRTAMGAGVVLQSIAERVRRASGAEAAFIERSGHADEPAAVVATTGEPAPALGARAPYPTLRGLHAERIVVDDGATLRLGAIVLLRRAGAPGGARSGRRLALMVDATRVALHVSALVDEVQSRRLELERAIDEKFRLISGITYELKETLGVAAEYVQLLDTEAELTVRQRDYIDSSRRTIASAVRLIGDLLEFTRVEAGQLPVQAEPTRIGALLRDMARDYRLASATYGVELVADVPTDLPSARTDPDLVKQILDNLFSNAVRYTPPNGTIHVHAAVQPGRRAGDPQNWLCITVTDSGPGVEDSHEIFEAVERVNKRRGAPGFRLAINRNIARLMGGDLTLESG
ncbi:MAG: sensor histidine kinase, partial [Longimicrobiales bacterium]